MLKRTMMLCAVGLTAAFVSAGASAHADVGVFFGFPGPVIEAPPPVVYQAPPPVVYQAPPVIYAPAPVAYGYPYGGEYRERPYWHDNGWHKGWKHHRHEDDDED